MLKNTPLFKDLFMLQKFIVTDVSCEPYGMQSQYIILLNNDEASYCINYIDTGNNAQYDEEIDITCNDSYCINPDNLDALWMWVGEHCYDIYDLKVGDVLKLDIPDTPARTKEAIINKQFAKQAQFEKNMARIRNIPPIPKPKRRPMTPK
jgi:hypothetical protein